MVAYRRVRVPGGTYFFTLTLADRSSKLLVARIDDLRCAFRTVLRTHPARVDAIAILPDHLHALWTLPANDCDYSSRWRLIKNHFTRRLRASGYSGSPNAKGEYAVWQSRFWEHQIRDEEDFARHIGYIHYNPVKHGLVSRPSDWRWSSFHRFVGDGRLPADWAGPVE
jgi:putative transposase